MIPKYTATLRLNSRNDDLEEKLKKYPNSFDEVLFFTQFTHSVKNTDFHEKEAEKIRPILDKAKALGIKTGIDVLASIGFFPEAVDPAMQNAKKYIYFDGTSNGGRICPFDKDNSEYIKNQYQIYARLSPDIIYIDDDISSFACACETCINHFAELNPTFFKNIDVNRQNFLRLLDSEDCSLRRQVRTAWIKFNSLRIGEIYSQIEKAVHEINSKIELGVMTHMSGTDGLDADTWAEAISTKEAPNIYWRPGGGVYTDFSLPDVCDKANRISAQIRYLPNYAMNIQSEIENFPYQSLKKSQSFTAFESFIYQAAGCTGTAFNVLSKDEAIGEEHEPFFKTVQSAREYGELLTNSFNAKPLCGVGFWWDKYSASFPYDEKWDINKSVPIANEIHQIGLPYSCMPEHMNVFFIDANTAMHIPDDELKKCFSKGVLLSGDALDILNKRGWNEYTGFRLAETYTADTFEEELEHVLNMPGMHKRNPRQAFGWVKDTYTIEKTNENAEYTARQRDLFDNIRGMSAGIFENSLGGRVAVEGITPFDWCFSLPRSYHMKKVISWLSKNSLPAYIESFHRVAVWSRNDTAFLANQSMEKAENIRIALKTEATKVMVYITDGSKITQKSVINIAEKNDYSVFVVPSIPITGTALIVPQFN